MSGSPADGAQVDTASVPRFRRGIKLRQDAARGGWVLLAPEKAFMLDAIAAEILQLVDGERAIEAICVASEFPRRAETTFGT